MPNTKHFVHKSVGPKMASPGAKYARQTSTSKYAFHEVADRQKKVTITCPACGRPVNIDITPGIFNRKALTLKLFFTHILGILFGPLLCIASYALLTYPAFAVELGESVAFGEFLQSCVFILELSVGFGGIYLFFTQFLDMYRVSGETVNKGNAYIEHYVE